jgi:hypothetical protein
MRVCACACVRACVWRRDPTDRPRPQLARFEFAADGSAAGAGFGWLAGATAPGLADGGAICAGDAGCRAYAAARLAGTEFATPDGAPGAFNLSVPRGSGRWAPAGAAWLPSCSATEFFDGAGQCPAANARSGGWSCTHTRTHARARARAHTHTHTQAST